MTTIRLSASAQSEIRSITIEFRQLYSRNRREHPQNWRAKHKALDIIGHVASSDSLRRICEGERQIAREKENALIVRYQIYIIIILIDMYHTYVTSANRRNTESRERTLPPRQQPLLKGWQAVVYSYLSIFT